MSMLSRFEKACAAFIERAFARNFPSELSPALVARKLVAVMEAHMRREDGRLIAPSEYVVRVHPEELARLGAEREYLQRQWAELLHDLALRVGASLNGPIRVTMSADERLPSGSSEIETIDSVRRANAAWPALALRVIKGLPPEQRYPLEGRVSVGRGAGVTIALVDPSVSRRHATIEIVNGAAILADLNSRNGTFVNGERVKKQPLCPGDVVRFGKTELRVEETA